MCTVQVSAASHVKTCNTVESWKNKVPGHRGHLLSQTSLPSTNSIFLRPAISTDAWGRAISTDVWGRAISTDVWGRAISTDVWGRAINTHTWGRAIDTYNVHMGQRGSHN